VKGAVLHKEVPPFYFGLTEFFKDAIILSV